MALFRRRMAGQIRWLVALDERTWQPALVEARGLEREPFREALDRELGWRLRLRRGKDFLISHAPRLHREIPLLIDDSDFGPVVGIEAVEFFLVRLNSAQARRSLDDNLAVQWWTAEELLATNPDSNWALPLRQRELLAAVDLFSGCQPGTK